MASGAPFGSAGFVLRLPLRAPKGEACLLFSSLRLPRPVSVCVVRERACVARWSPAPGGRPRQVFCRPLARFDSFNSIAAAPPLAPPRPALGGRGEGSFQVSLIRNLAFSVFQSEG